MSNEPRALLITHHSLLNSGEVMTDPIADMLTRMRNAYAAKHQKVDVPVSKIKLEIARILKEEGFINNYKLIGEGVRRNIRVYLRYGTKGELVMSKLERVSKPGCRVYVKGTAVPSVLGGMGINIISTSRGVMTDRRARRDKVGGEVLCRIY
jgi:small subunit ribosomal protein S8